MYYPKINPDVKANHTGRLIWLDSLLKKRFQQRRVLRGSNSLSRTFFAAKNYEKYTRALHLVIFHNFMVYPTGTYETLTRTIFYLFCPYISPIYGSSYESNNCLFSVNTYVRSAGDASARMQVSALLAGNCASPSHNCRCVMRHLRGLIM